MYAHCAPRKLSHCFLALITIISPSTKNETEYSHAKMCTGLFWVDFFVAVVFSMSAPSNGTEHPGN